MKRHKKMEPKELEKLTNMGELLISLLDLKVKPNGRVDTDWGDKTPLGLALTIKRIAEDDRSD